MPRYDLNIAIFDTIRYIVPSLYLCLVNGEIHIMGAKVPEKESPVLISIIVPATNCFGILCVLYFMYL